MKLKLEIELELENIETFIKQDIDELKEEIIFFFPSVVPTSEYDFLFNKIEITKIETI